MATEEQTIEFVKCLEDTPYTLKTYNETFDQTQNKYVPFELFREQENLIDLYENNRFVLVSKYRQAGITTVTAGYCGKRIVFGDPENPDKILIMANKQDTAFEFLSKIKTFIDQYPLWLGIGKGDNKDKGALHYGKESQKHITILDKDDKVVGEVKAVATSIDALRGYTPTLLIIDEAAFVEGGADLWGACLASLGCLTKDTLILTDNGLVELDELVKEKEILGFTDLVEPYKVCNIDGNLVNATQTFVSEYGETYKIKTKLGIEIEGSWKHPIFLKDKQWVRMQDLNVGDQVVIQYNQNLFGNTTFNFEHTPHGNEKIVEIPTNLEHNLNFAYLLGLFVAEGNFTKNGIAITNADPEIIDFLVNDGCNLGFNFKKSREYHYMFHSTKLVKWFDSFGLKKHNARDKEIPLALLKMPKSVIKAFLQGMFDGDGMSTVKEIKYSSTSHKLVKTLQTVLLNFGIISHIRKEVCKTSLSSVIPNKNHITTIYNLFIYSNHALKFYDEIGFRLERKQKNKYALENKIQNRRYVEVDKKEIKELITTSKLSKTQFKFLTRFFNSKYDRITYESIYKLQNIFKSNPVVDRLLLEIEKQKNYYIDEIISIEKSQDYTYDLHVPETHSFISNGIISHNTGGKAIMISTPRGMDELYYKTYVESLNGVNTFKIFQMYWYDDPRYNKDLFFVKYDGNLVDWLSNPEIRDNHEIKENGLNIPREEWDQLIRDGWKPCSPWFEAMCRELNFDKRTIAQELECVGENTLVTVRDKTSGYIQKITIGELYKQLNNISINLTTNTTYNILTPNGFKDFDGIQKLKKTYLEIEFENGITLQTSYNHLIYDYDGNEILAKDIQINDKIKSHDGFLVVKAITKFDTEIDLYDAINVKDGNIYYTNDIISHNCNFNSSGDNVVDSKIIEKQEQDNVIDPIEKQLEQKLWIWKHPEIGHKYIAGIDISRGDSEDFSCMNIIDFDTMEQVVEYKTKLPPDIFAEIVFKWAHKYTAFIVVDITGGMGVATSRKLQELTYPNELLYFDNIKDADRWKYGIYDDKTAGINYNTKRAQIVQAFEEAVRTGFKIRSKRLIQEMKTFVYINGRADHMQGHHDDAIQSMAMALYVAQNSFTKLKQNEKQVKAMLNAWTTSTVAKDNVTKPKINNNQPGTGYMWLFSGLK